MFVVREEFFCLERSKQEKIRKRGLEDYIEAVSGIISYFANEGKAEEILDLLKRAL